MRFVLGSAEGACFDGPMRRIRVSGQRMLMLSFYDEPSCDPYVCITMDVTLEPAQQFLDAFEREHGERAGVQHLVTAAVGRCLHEMPSLNVKIVGREFYQLDRVDIAVPVHLGRSAKGDDTGMTVLNGVERMTLRDVVRETRARVRAEREGSVRAFGTAFGRKLANQAPRAVRLASDLASTALRYRAAYRLLGPWASVSTGVTNVGAVFALPQGARYRSAALTMPSKFGHVASAFALAPACDAPVAEEGRVAVRRVLPITMLVDHRAIDGYLMAKLGERLAELLLAPSALGAAAVA